MKKKTICWYDTIFIFINNVNTWLVLTIAAITRSTNDIFTRHKPIETSWLSYDFCYCLLSTDNLPTVSVTNRNLHTSCSRLRGRTYALILMLPMCKSRNPLQTILTGLPQSFVLNNLAIIKIYRLLCYLNSRYVKELYKGMYFISIYQIYFTI